MTQAPGLRRVKHSLWPNGNIDFFDENIFWILIRTCSSSVLLDAALDGTHTRYSKVRAIAEGEGRHSRWGLWNTGISSRLPSLQLHLSMLSRKGWKKCGQKPNPDIGLFAMTYAAGLTRVKNSSWPNSNRFFDRTPPAVIINAINNIFSANKSFRPTGDFWPSCHSDF